MSGSWGRMLPPPYLRAKRVEQQRVKLQSLQSTQYNEQGPEQIPSLPLPQQSIVTTRTVFSTYSLSPVRVKGILLMRVLDGYRARRYGHSTHDPDKVSIHFTLPLDFGLTLHYELSYVASPFYNPMLGSAHVKIELSGDPTFVQSVKNDFSQVNVQWFRHATVARRLSSKICKFLRWLRKEDCLEAYLCPLEWGDKLSAGSPFLRRLGSLAKHQRFRHFDMDSFEVVLTGNDPYYNRESLLSEFLTVDDGEEEMMDRVDSWSTRVIMDRRAFFKELPSSPDDPATYCIVEVRRSVQDGASRLYTIVTDFFGCLDASRRLDVTHSLKAALHSCEHAVVLPRMPSRMLVGHRSATTAARTAVADPLAEDRSELVKNYLCHERWDLVRDMELLPLLTRRRLSSLGNFWLLDSSSTHATFAKYVVADDVVAGRVHTDSAASVSPSSELYLVQYQLRTERDHMTVEIYMEAERGVFRPFSTRRMAAENKSMFAGLYEKIKRRDQECARALRSRRNLLNIFREKDRDSSSHGSLPNLITTDDHAGDVRRLLMYSSCVARKLRFFHAGTGPANEILADLTVKFLLSQSFDLKVKRLSIGADSIASTEPGVWFIVSHDRHTLSLVHFASSEKVEKESDTGFFMYRELSFYTVGVTDLYYTKNDIHDETDSVDETHFSEHISVTEIADLIEKVHGRNYARAAYLALRTRDLSAPFEAFSVDDYDFLMGFCTSVKIADELVSQDLDSSGENASTRCRLAPLLMQMLQPIPVLSDYGAKNNVSEEKDEFIADEDKLEGEAFVMTEHDSTTEMEEQEESSQRMPVEDAVAAADTVVETVGQDVGTSGGPGSSTGCFFYYDGEEGKKFILRVMNVTQHDRIAPPAEYESDDDDMQGDETDAPHASEHDIVAVPSRDSETDTTEESVTRGSTSDLASLLTPPIFVSFSLDGKRGISFDDLNAMNSTSRLSAFITVFRKESRSGALDIGIPGMPDMHHAVALELIRKLNSFVAEQALERLRHIGTGISDIDIRTAVRSLMSAKNVASTKVPIEFYAPETDSMILASTSTGGNEGTLERDFALLFNEIGEQKLMPVKQTKSGDFFAVDEEVSILPFWCFLQVQKNAGIILINCWHPDGIDKAERVVSQMNDAASRTCHRVNQLLLLESLHRTKIASVMLIKKDAGSDADISADSSEQISRRVPRVGERPPGFFHCSPKFRKIFPLYHRCTKEQAVTFLQSSVLHNFPVSNRRGLFVYKDEDGHVFYMKLLQSPTATAAPSSGGDVEDNSITFIVYGVKQPGTSIYDQLNRLLQKKLATMALDSLSSVLTKNPCFNLLPPDMEFLREFETNWKILEDDQDEGDEHERIYSFPCAAYDPAMILVFFRQNIAGSGFFHRLHEADVEADIQAHGVTDESIDQVSVVDSTNKASGVHFEPREFSLFFNNSPSQLDPNLQAVSTLTSAGKQYSRQSGNGIALIEISLLNRDKQPVENISIASLPKLADSLPNDPIQLFSLVADDASPTSRDDISSSQFYLKVKIVNTTLKLLVIHKWLHTTLNQALIGWLIERHIERAKHDLLATPVVGKGDEPDAACATGVDRRVESIHVDKLCRGLPTLQRMLRIDFPHPALHHLEMETCPLRATTLATLTLDFLERALLPGLFGERKHVDCHCVRVIRTSGGQSAVVNLQRATRGDHVVKVSRENGSCLKDRRYDSPEYLFVFGLSDLSTHSDKRRSYTVPKSSMVFNEVSIESSGDKTETPFSRMLSTMKKLNPSAFSRTLSFVLSVNREKRTILTYNWQRDSFATVAARLKDIELEAIKTEGQASTLGVNRFLTNSFFYGSLGGKVDTDERGNEKASSTTSISNRRPPIGAVQKKRESEEIKGDSSKQTDTKQLAGPTRKIRRPTSIRRPKLVGKSVEGAAMQAVAASRARASARPRPSRSRTGLTNAPAAKSHKDKTASGTVATVGKHKESQARALSEIDKRKTPKKTRKLLDFGDFSPSVILREHQIIQRYQIVLSLRSRLPSFVAQNLTARWVVMLRDKGISPQGINLILSNATAVKSDSCNLFRCSDEHTNELFVKYLASRLEAESGARIIKMKTQSKMPTYMKVDLTHDRSSYTASLIVEIAVIKQESLGVFACRRRVSLLIGSSKQQLDCKHHGTSTGHDFGRAHKSRRSERKVSSLHAAILRFCDRFDFSPLLFNFSSSLVKESVTKGENSNLNILHVLEEMQDRFPCAVQRRMHGLKFRLLHITLSFDSRNSSFEALGLFDYLCSHPPLDWKVIGGKGYSRCLSSETDAIGVSASVILVLKNQDSFDVFVLCSSEGVCLDAYVFDEGSPYAHKLSNKVLRRVRGLAVGVLQTGATNLRRDTLWAKYSLPLTSVQASLPLNELCEMCQLSSATPLMDTDERLKEVLRKGSKITINWPSVLFSMKQDPLFSHSVSFTPENKSSTVYLFRYSADDLFFLFEVEDGLLNASNILNRELLSSNSKGITKATNVFVNWLLHWIWHNI